MTSQRLIESAEGSEATTLDERSEPFDWNALDRALGEAELGPIEYERLQFALRRILGWLIGNENTGAAGNAGRKDLIAGRVVGLAWATSPELFDERPSLRNLAAQLKISKSSLSRAAAQATADFGLQNREQIETRKRTRRELSPDEIRRN